MSESEPAAAPATPAPGDPQATRPGPYLLAAAIVLAVVLVGAVAAIPLLLRSAAPPDLSAVQAYPGLLRDHVRGEVDYPVSPPVGGRHADAWLDCGVYDEPVPEENAVHSLEHGTVWITHAPDLPADQLERLRAVLPAEGILSPHDGLPGPVVVTVWGRQLVLDGADDERLEAFVAEYGDGQTAPEPFASCEGGVDETGRLPGPEQSA